MKRLAILSVLAACGADDPRLAPVYDQPVGDPDATATGLDELQLAIAHAGNDTDIVSESFAPADAAELTGFPFADDLVVHLAGRIGTSDVAYGRTCSFALAADRDPPSPHLFFARAVKFASTGITSHAHTGDLAGTFADGSALLVTGTAAERFDPRTNALLPLTTTLDSRTNGIATTFGLGAAQQVALVGGSAASIELVGPDGRVDRVDDSRLARTGATATALTDGRLVVIGGRVDGTLATDVLELSSAASEPELRAPVQLAHPRTGHTATRLGDDVGASVLVVGGADAGGLPIPDAELYKPLSGTLADPRVFDPHLITPRTRHRAALMPDGSVLVIGGVDGAGAPVRTLERFTIDGGFAPAGLLPDNAGITDFSVTTLPDGRILLAGGLSPTGTPVDAAFIARLDVIDGTVDIVATDRLAIPRAQHAAVRLCDGTILVSGGTATDSELERYNPPATGRR